LGVGSNQQRLFERLFGSDSAVGRKSGTTGGVGLLFWCVHLARTRTHQEEDRLSPVLAEPAAPPDHHLANLIEIFIPFVVPPSWTGQSISPLLQHTHTFQTLEHTLPSSIHAFIHPCIHPSIHPSIHSSLVYQTPNTALYSVTISRNE
jgi:hypothetical protein